MLQANRGRVIQWNVKVPLQRGRGQCGQCRLCPLATCNQLREHRSPPGLWAAWVAPAVGHHLILCGTSLLKSFLFKLVLLSHLRARTALQGRGCCAAGLHRAGHLRPCSSVEQGQTPKDRSLGALSKTILLHQSTCAWRVLSSGHLPMLSLYAQPSLWSPGSVSFSTGPTITLLDPLALPVPAGPVMKMQELYEHSIRASATTRAEGSFCLVHPKPCRSPLPGGYIQSQVLVLHTQGPGVKTRDPCLWCVLYLRSDAKPAAVFTRSHD